ncbi:hypothetical protein ACRB8A_12425 [Arthrobacter sp. G.S.26]|uniref:hypothetical protein n=1 Tax=Arthrobacter sp. G.S.26 TaxID=3433706 RepID=UPI003D7786DA
MGQINNLSESEFPDILRRIRVLERATNQNNMAIGRGGLTVYGGGAITIENGGLNVTGSATITGILNADGTVNLTGIIGVSGPLTVTGTTALNGPTTVGGNTTVNGDLTTNGKLDVNGPTTLDGNTTATGDLTVNGPLNINGTSTLKGDLNVTGNGKIKAGGMTVDPGLLGGSVQFTNGGYLSGTTDGPQLTGPAGNAFVYVRNALAGIQAAAIKLVGAVTVQGGLQITGLPTTTQPANLHIDSSGNVSRSTA